MNDALQKLSDRVAELEDVLGLTARFPRDLFAKNTFRLRSCEPLLGLLMARPFVPHQAAYDALWGAKNEIDQPDPKALMATVCWLRKGLAPHGIKITNVFGSGYYIDDASKVRLRAVLDARPA